MELYIDQERDQVDVEAPHVVILGAGASLAAFPNGDKNGLLLPLMNNFVETIGLHDILSQVTIESQSNNFEDIYSELYKNSQYNMVRYTLENRIQEYFRKFELPAFPTIYDHLLLSLRGKDCIATFNWDPLLTQAYLRNRTQFDLPNILYLHGNVGIGYCSKHNKFGFSKSMCPECSEVLQQTTLLFPILEKDYGKDGFISFQWKLLHQYLKHAFMITIFGYSAPTSDTRAIQLMKLAWGEIERRNLEQIEIIDIKNERELKKSWDAFIFSHHFFIHNNFYDSWISKHPRRTGEAYHNQFIEAQFIEDNPIPKDVSLIDLWEWLKEYQNVERNHRFAILKNEENRRLEILKGKRSLVTYFIFSVNNLIDSEKLRDLINLEETRKHVQNGHTIDFLKDKFRNNLDFSLFHKDFETAFNEQMADIAIALHGRECRKFGIGNNGLCLLIAYVTEIIQRIC